MSLEKLDSIMDSEPMKMKTIYLYIKENCVCVCEF